MALAVAGALVSGCAQPDAPVARRDRPTIVSLNPCADAILAEVAPPGALLAISHYSHDPGATSMELAKAHQFRSTGGAVEEILALDPDIVIADTFLAPATRSALERLGYRIETIAIASTVSDSKAQVTQLAKIAGDPSAGKVLNARIDTALAAAEPVDRERPAALVWQAGGIVPGEGTLVAELLARSGFANHSAIRGMAQADYLPLESVLADPPEVVLAAGSGEGGANRQLTHPALTSLVGTRREAFDPALLWCGGPTIIRAAERLAEVRASTRPREGGDLPRDGERLPASRERDSTLTSPSP